MWWVGFRLRTMSGHEWRSATPAIASSCEGHRGAPLEGAVGVNETGTVA